MGFTSIVDRQEIGSTLVAIPRSKAIQLLSKEVMLIQLEKANLFSGVSPEVGEFYKRYIESMSNRSMTAYDMVMAWQVLHVGAPHELIESVDKYFGDAVKAIAPPETAAEAIRIRSIALELRE